MCWVECHHMWPRHPDNDLRIKQKRGYLYIKLLGELNCNTPHECVLTRCVSGVSGLQTLKIKFIPLLPLPLHVVFSMCWGFPYCTICVGSFSYKWTNLSLPCPIKGIFLLWMLTGFASSFRLGTIRGFLGCGRVTRLLSLLFCGLETHTVLWPLQHNSLMS